MDQPYEDLEMDEPLKSSTYDGEILEIEEEEEEESILASKISYLKSALSGKSKSII